eukprot:gene34338-46058_t
MACRMQQSPCAIPLNINIQEPCHRYDSTTWNLRSHATVKFVDNSPPERRLPGRLTCAANRATLATRGDNMTNPAALFDQLQALLGPAGMLTGADTEAYVADWRRLYHGATPAVLVAFFPIFSGALTGLKAVDPDLERLFDLYGATRWQKLTRLRLPTAVPFLLEGHKVAAGLAVVGAVVAEFGAGSGGSQGLAWRILEASNRLQTAKAFAALFVLAVMGAGLYAILQVAERRALVWWRGR